MTTRPATQARFVSKMLEQLRFLKRSCMAFDEGFEEESLRIATALRIIFHDPKSPSKSNKTVSLIRHLGLENQTILSSSRGLGDWKDYLSQKIDLRSPQPISMVPLLGEQFFATSIEDWWSREPVFIHDAQAYTRQMIVLAAANRDGGAHVDSDLDTYYEALSAGEYALGITGNLEYYGPPPFPQGETIYPKNAHLALLRQFAYEALTSVEYYGWLACAT